MSIVARRVARLRAPANVRSPASCELRVVPQPPPLRSSHFPFGLPNILQSAAYGPDCGLPTGCTASRPRSSLPCLQEGRYVSIENPATSHFWTILDRLVLEWPSSAHPGQICHPASCGLCPVYTWRHSPQSVSFSDQCSVVLKAQLLPKQLAPEEAALRDSMPVGARKVLGSKNLDLWEPLLRQEGYDDLNVIPLLQQGIPLVGTPDTPAYFEAKLTPATITKHQLRGNRKMPSQVTCGQTFEHR